MNNINIQLKKYRYSFMGNLCYFIAALCCISILLFAGILLYPFALKAQEYLISSIGVMNNAVRGSYR